MMVDWDETTVDHGAVLFANCCMQRRSVSYASCSWTTGPVSTSIVICRPRVTDSFNVLLAVVLAAEWTRGTHGQDTLGAASGSNTRVAFPIRLLDGTRGAMWF